MQDNKLIKDIKAANPDIFKRKIERWSSAFSQKLWPFVKEHYWHSNASVNVFRVVGTQHPDYAGFTWVEFLEKGKRMGLNLKLQEENPGYYYETRNKEPVMYYNSIDGGDLYIGDDGNHRTCIARAVFYLKGDSILHGVTVNDYRIDWRLRDIYDRLLQIIEEKKLSYFVEPQSEVVSRDDSGGWMLEKYKTTFKVKDFKKGKNLILDGEEIGGFLESVKNTGVFNLKLQEKNGFLGKFFSFRRLFTYIPIGMFFMFFASGYGYAGDLPVTADKKVLSEDIKGQSDNSYHKGKGSGWYWYEDTKEEGKEEKKTEQQPQPATKPDPWEMTTDELKKLIDDTKKNAVANPTPENVLEYIEAQDVARKKASAFAASYMLMMQTHPEYSTAPYYPITTPGRDALYKIKNDELAEVIGSAREDFALIYFMRPTCEYCQAQTGILKYFINKYGWDIKPVNIEEEPQAAYRFNVTTVPHLLLIYKKTGDFMPVATGVISLDGLENTLSRTIRYMRGEIKPSQFLTPDYNLGGALDPDVKIQQSGKDISPVKRDIR
ncbi:MAG: conjugal transfer protein TraF [Deltaproteobacteria bacterium]|nr:conjugal transfer protein TraF [Deltaproteobacteria bacterium]